MAKKKKSLRPLARWATAELNAAHLGYRSKKIGNDTGHNVSNNPANREG